MVPVLGLSALLSISEWSRWLSASRMQPWQLTSAADSVQADPLPPPIHPWGMVHSVSGTRTHPELATVQIRASIGQDGKSSLSRLCACS